MPSGKKAEVLTAFGCREEEEEEEEDEALPEVYVKNATSSDPDTKPILSQPSTSSSISSKSSKKGRATVLPSPPSLPTDVPALQQALLSAEGRLVGFQAREQAYLRILTEKEKETADLKRHLRELAVFQSPPEAWARTALVDPGVGMELRLLRDKISELERSEKILKEDAQAHHFSTESATGEALLNKCRKLQQENEVLATRLEKEGGKDLGREEELKLQIVDLQKALEESQARVEDLDEERGLLSTMLYALKKQLMAATSTSAMMAAHPNSPQAPPPLSLASA